MTLYLLMALGHGAIHLASGRVFYYGRFIDWSVTTPLLLLSLISGSLKGQTVRRGGLIAGLIAADVYMIITGLVAGWTDDPSLKWGFYFLSCLAFLFIYGLLWGPFKRFSTSSPEGSQYIKKASALSIIWFAYPIVFLIGQQGLRLWSPMVDAVLFTSLDLIAKVVYGLWAVSMIHTTSDTVRYSMPIGGPNIATSR
jgi:bacteriorhodopsin